MFRRGREPKAPKEPAPSSVSTDAPKPSRSPLRRLRLHAHRPSESSSNSRQAAGETQCDLERTSDLLSVPSDLSKDPSQVSHSGSKAVQNASSVHGENNEPSSTVQENLNILQAPENIPGPYKGPEQGRPISCLWDEAYLCLNEQDATLMNDYRECLMKMPDGQALVVPARASAGDFFGMSKGELHKEMLRAIRLRTEGNEAKRWKLKFLGHELAVKNMVKPVVGIIEWAKDYVGTALEPSAVGSAAWAGVCLLLPLMLNPGTQGEERLKTLSHITLLLSQCKMREELYRRRYENEANMRVDTPSSQEHHEAYKVSLRDLYIKILSFLATCSVYLSKNSITRLARSMVVWDGWKDLNDGILSQEQDVLNIEARFEALRVQEEWEMKQDWNRRTLVENHALAEEVGRIKVMMHDERRTKLLQWLTSVNIDAKYNDEREKHQEGTGAWLLKGSKFADWKRVNNSLLWLHGKAGAGKSNLSATAINNLMTEFREDDEVVVAYFYFDFRDLKKQNAKAMIQSLIYQICKRNPTIPPAVLELWDKYRHNAQAQEPGLKDDLLPALEGALVGFRSIYVVLDGLDECPSENGSLRALLATFNTMHGWAAPQLHMFLTSRFILEIHEKLSPLTAINRNVQIDLEQVREVNDDIRKFVMAELSEHGNWSDEAKDTVASALIMKAEGMFQYVTLQLQGPLRRAKTASQRANALKNLPQGLNATYERALLTIPVEERTHAIRALKWLLASLRTLKLTELAEASRIDLEADPILEEGTELDTAMSVWDMLPPGLVTLGGGEERKIHFSHSSFPEYLLSSTLQQSPSDAKVFCISQGMAIAYVLECCMAYQIHATRTRQSVDELQERSSKFPLWDYAASHWMRHLESIPYDYWNVTYPRLAELAGQMLEDNPGLCLQDMVKIAAPGGDDWVEELSLVNGGTALYYVALCGHLQLLRFLLQRKDVQVNAVCDRGTALTAACANGHGAIIRALLDHGADPWKGSESCCCALKAAMMSGNEEIVHSICSHPCEGELMDMCRAVDFSPLDLAIDRHSVELVRYLVVHGIAINTRGGYYGTPLQAAAFKYDCDIAEYMLQMGADVNAEGGQYGHALQAAACIGYKRIIEVLLQHKASVNARSGVFGYALHAGAMTGRVEIVKILLKSGADANAYGGKYGYALEGSAYMGHRFTAEALINAGARINAQGGFYGNALQAAVASNERDMANFLLKSGARVQPPGPRFEAVLTRVRDLDDGEEMVAALEKFQRENWTFSLNDPAPSFMQNPDNGCWQVSGAAEEDPWMEWWRNAPDNWRKSYEIIIPIGPDIRV